jgi:hypothetical protein
MPKVITAEFSAAGWRADSVRGHCSRIRGHPLVKGMDQRPWVNPGRGSIGRLVEPEK